MKDYFDIKNQRNTKIILDLLRKNKQMKRTEIYKEVMKIRLINDKKKINYQVVCRDVSRLLKANLIKVVSGGQRSQVLSLS